MQFGCLKLGTLGRFGNLESRQAISSLLTELGMADAHLICNYPNYEWSIVLNN